MLKTTVPPEPIDDEIKTLFSIHETSDSVITKEQLLEALSSITTKESTITCSNKPISASKDYEAIVICVPSQMNTVSGLAHSICEKYGIIPRPNIHNLKLGIVLLNKELVQFFV